MKASIILSSYNNLPALKLSVDRLGRVWYIKPDAPGVFMYSTLLGEVSILEDEASDVDIG